ncbi:hypothetical protein WME76_37890 [Sorangium sp. So ce119]|uniref:hypothetical protein n=1 Tax=Sorangium sp. So ce119 TaxID=3133279 RepID=UPI003F5E6B20
MTTLIVEGIVPLPAASTVQTFWSLERLRESWPAIVAFDVHYEDDAHQEVSMVVDRDGELEHIRVVRFLRGNDVEFFNPVAPPAMTFHRGLWAVTPFSADRSHVRIEREYELRRLAAEDDAMFVERRARFRAAFRARLEAILASVGAERRPAAPSGRRASKEGGS